MGNRAPQRPEASAVEKWRTISAVDKPLGFYVLALLIVESFIGIVAALGRENKEMLPLGLWLGVGMFVYITLMVTLICWFKAHVLMFDSSAHARDRKTSPLGNEKKTVKDASTLGTPGTK